MTVQELIESLQQQASTAQVTVQIGTANDWYSLPVGYVEVTNAGIVIGADADDDEQDEFWADEKNHVTELGG